MVWGWTANRHQTGDVWRIADVDDMFQESLCALWQPTGRHEHLVDRKSDLPTTFRTSEFLGHTRFRFGVSYGDFGSYAFKSNGDRSTTRMNRMLNRLASDDPIKQTIAAMSTTGFNFMCHFAPTLRGFNELVKDDFR